ncbi:MAG: prepilin-type N-terminal cleavage/methylation domain-containing protein [Candidatus Eremiobacteraeota bacterium]|nr:prepilin-type N-terminal cleavage/methylation domain-containing protein [Candidatus Eremiobacteraeota bacterium]
MGDDKKGFTLAELMVSSFLFLIILGIVLQFLFFSNTYWKSGEARMGVSLAALTATERIRREIRGAPYYSITNNTSSSPKAISFASSRDIEGNYSTDIGGDLQIQKQVIYYIPAGTRILRRIEFLTDSGEALTVAELETYCDGSGQMISNCITGFTAVENDTEQSIEITIEAEKYDGSNQNTMVLDSKLYFFGK